MEDKRRVAKELKQFMPYLWLNRLLIQRRVRDLEFNILLCCFFFKSANRPFGRYAFKALQMGEDASLYNSLRGLEGKGYITVARDEVREVGKANAYHITPAGERFLLDVAKQARKNHKVLRELLPEYFPDFYRLRKAKNGSKNNKPSDNETNK